MGDDTDVAESCGVGPDWEFATIASPLQLHSWMTVIAARALARAKPLRSHAISSNKTPAKVSRAVRLQFGALPYRFTDAGTLEILLVTSRNSRRWIIPKGWRIGGREPAKLAAHEAYEAGVRGLVTGKAIGTFSYEKRLDDESSSVPCEAPVFPLLVKRQLKTWPEQTSVSSNGSILGMRPLAWRKTACGS